MEYWLFEQLEGGSLGSRIVYRGANPVRLDQISELTDLIVGIIADKTRERKDILPAGEYRPIVKRSAYGAEIFAVPAVFSLVANEFHHDVRECLDMLWAQTVSPMPM